MSPLAACPTCRQRHPPPKEDGCGGLVDNWDCWACLDCGAMVCNVPVSAGRGGRATMPCYVRHLEAAHPERYMRVEVEQEDDGRWVADVVDVPGAMAYGETLDAAVDAAKALTLRVLADGPEPGSGRVG